MNKVTCLYTDHYILKLYEAAYFGGFEGVTDASGKHWTEVELINILIEKGYEYVGTKYRI
jgi:hypothetical protein